MRGFFWVFWLRFVSFVLLKSDSQVSGRRIPAAVTKTSATRDATFVIVIGKLVLLLRRKNKNTLRQYRSLVDHVPVTTRGGVFIFTPSPK